MARRVNSVTSSREKNRTSATPSVRLPGQLARFQRSKRFRRQRLPVVRRRYCRRCPPSEKGVEFRIRERRISFQDRAQVVKVGGGRYGGRLRRRRWPRCRVHRVRRSDGAHRRHRRPTRVVNGGESVATLLQLRQQILLQ